MSSRLPVSHMLRSFRSQPAIRCCRAQRYTTSSSRRSEVLASLSQTSSSPTAPLPSSPASPSLTSQASSLAQQNISKHNRATPRKDPSPHKSFRPRPVLSDAAFAPTIDPSEIRYHVPRIPLSQFLPVYLDLKKGDTLKLTLVRKVTGDRQQLCDQLRDILPLKDPKNDAKINPVNGHIVFKGHWKKEIVRFLEAHGF